MGDPTKQEKITIEEFIGIWDTGATGSVITSRVVEKLGLKAIRVTEVHHAGGTSVSNVYLVNIALPNNVMVQGVRVTEGILPESDDAEVLIGMDIIGMGDFAITNAGGRTTLSFRMPPSKEIDFIPEVNEMNMANMNRHDRRVFQSQLKKFNKRDGK